MSKGNRNRTIRQLNPEMPYEEYPFWLKERISDAAKELATNAIDAHLNNCDSIILWCLRSEFGFGKKRLRRYYDKFIELYHELMEQYESYLDSEFWCAEKLRDIGIDVASWNKDVEPK